MYPSQFDFYMFSVYLSFALSLSRASKYVVDDPTYFLCDPTIDSTKCTNAGMCVYISQGSRPSTFYVISHTQWAFTESSNTKYLGTSSSVENISGHYSGVFTAPKSAVYTFKLWLYHDVKSGVCYFDVDDCPAYIEIDFDYSGTGTDYSRSCNKVKNTICSTDTITWYVELVAKFYLMKSRQYPLFAGMRSTHAVPQSTAPPWMKLIYTYGQSSSYARVGKEAVAGLAGYSAYTVSPSRSATRSVSPSISATPYVDTPAPTEETSTDSDIDSDDSLVVSDSGRTSTILIGGICVGAVVVAVICALVVWALVRKAKNKKESSAGDTSSRRRDSSSYRSGRDSKRSSSRSHYDDKKSRRDDDKKSRRDDDKKSRRDDDKKSRRDDRAGSGRTSRADKHGYSSSRDRR